MQLPGKQRYLSRDWPSFTFAVLAILFLLFINSCNESHQDNAVPRAVQGVIDLSHWNFTRNGPAHLDGEWEFYWHALLEPGQINDSLQIEPQFFLVPNVWDDKHQPVKLPGEGYGTYKLKIILNSYDHYYAVKMSEVYTAFTLWINGDQIFSAGKVGNNRAEAISGMHPHTTQFSVEGDTVDVVIQVSNFTFKNGGLRNTVEFGPADQLQAARENSPVLNYILFGSVFMMSIYHFGLFSLHREDKSTIYFGLFCLLIAIRILVTSEALIVKIFPGLSWDVQLKIIVLGYYLTLPVFITYMNKLFLHQFNRLLIRAFQAVGILASLIVLITPMSIYMATEVIYQAIILIAFTYVLGGLIKAVQENKEGALWVTGGLIVLLATAINDIGYANRIIVFQRYQNLLPFGLFIFILSQSYMLSHRFTKALKLATILEDEKLVAQTKAFKAEQALTEMLRAQVEEKESHVSTLKGLLPICSSCKKIRDDEGYWQQVEKYVGDHSEAKFSHGLCPDCVKAYYPDLDLDE